MLQLDKARELFEQGDMLEAAELLRPILARVDNPVITSRALMLQAELDRKAGDLDAALEHLQAASEGFGDRSAASLAYAMAGITNPVEEIDFVELHDAYKSIYEAFSHAGIANDCRVKVRKVRAEDVLDVGLEVLEGVDGLLVPGASARRRNILEDRGSDITGVRCAARSGR